MELIVGGAYQGKTEYARRLFPDISWADGEHCSFEELCQYQGILKFHRYLERRMAAGESVADLAEILYQENSELVIVTDEIGCGIVPMDPFQREVREQTGRVCTALAGKARRVHRVICGVGTVIKG